MRFLSFLLAVLICATMVPVIPQADASLASERRKLIRAQREIKREMRRSRKNVSRLSYLKIRLQDIQEEIEELRSGKTTGTTIPASATQTELDVTPVTVNSSDSETNNSSSEARRQRIIDARNRRQLSPVKLNTSEPTTAPDPVPHAELFETGVASYYADKFNGRSTASGAIFNNSEMTAAHKTLPFGTKVRVTNPENGNFVDVTITDRGPYSAGRVIDLTAAAFQQLTPLSRGLVDVEVHILEAVE